MHVESNENFRRKSARLLKRWIAAFGAAIMAAICVLVTVAVLKEREAALEQARIEAATLSASFEQQISGTLNGLASAMELLKDRIETEGPAFDPGAWKTKVPELLSPAIQIVLVDAQGKVRAATPGQDPARIYPAERDFFATHRRDPHPEFLVEPASAKNIHASCDSGRAEPRYRRRPILRCSQVHGRSRVPCGFTSKSAARADRFNGNCSWRWSDRRTAYSGWRI